MLNYSPSSNSHIYYFTYSLSNIEIPPLYTYLNTILKIFIDTVLLPFDYFRLKD